MTATDIRPLLDEDARQRGIVARHDYMANGEVRFRLLADDGTGYVRTHSSEASGWQNSHYHKAMLETYIVQIGWAAFVELVDGQLVWHPLRPGDVYTTRPDVAHNVYLASNTIIHTVKHGIDTVSDDWHSAPDLDMLTKHLSARDVAAAAGTP